MPDNFHILFILLGRFTMRIFDINIYRDGGSIEFYIERNGHTRQIWLETPFRGEPRALRVDTVAVSRGDAASGQLLTDIEEWWATFSPEVQQRIHDLMAHKGPLYNPDAEMMHASDLSRVLFVRDYVTKNYAA